MASGKALNRYGYRLPQELIAQKPVHPRDSARLLVYDRKSRKIFFDQFNNLLKYLPEGAVLVFNETKVVPARFSVKKSTGGRLKLLYLNTLNGRVNVLCEENLAPGSRLFLSAKKYFKVLGKVGSVYRLRPSFPIGEFKKFLDEKGEAPIPPYLRKTPLTGKFLSKAYQTVFAKKEGSVAAPTASLHFTRKMMLRLKRSGFGVKFITLHVGLGTFAPISPLNLKRKKLHEEKFEIDAQTARFLNAARASGQPIVAVGTTVARTLETAVGKNGQLKPGTGKTELFIREGYKFRFCDALITNFHVPCSSLLMLVSAFAGRKRTLGLYKKAISKKFRFFSFGDAMLVL